MNQFQLFIINILYILNDVVVNKAAVAIWQRASRSALGLIFFYLGIKMKKFTLYWAVLSFGSTILLQFYVIQEKIKIIYDDGSFSLTQK